MNIRWCLLKKVLIVDDVLIVRNIVVNLFKNSDDLSDFEVLTASNGRDAYDIIKKQTIHVMILDWMLEEESGLDLVKKLKFEYDTTRIMMLSSIAERHRVREAAQTGIADYIVKPLVKENFIPRFLKVASMINATSTIETKNP